VASTHPIPGREALRRMVEGLAEGLVARDGQARCMLLATLCGEHVLLVGPPGTAKSELARRLQRIVGGAWFERLLTRFTVPEELFGPLSLAALDDGRYQREIDGYLPTATVAFLDEVFKANSAILNALLTLLNERAFDQGPDRVAVPLVTLVGATNELPADEGLQAFLDRFLFRCAVPPVADDGFVELLAFGARNARAADDGAGGPPAPLTAAVIAAVAQAAARVALPPDVLGTLVELRAWLREAGHVVSDRRWVQASQVLRVVASTHGRAAVALSDLWVLRWVLVHEPGDVGRFDDWFAARLGGERALAPERLGRLAQAWERQLEIEERATELSYDDSGKLALARSLGGADEAQVSEAAPRMSAFSRRRRFSASHVGARLAQLDALLAEVDAWLHDMAAHAQAVRMALDAHVWIDPAFALTVARHQRLSAEAMSSLRDSFVATRRAFAALPLAEVDDGRIPEPVRA
jgi:MoxR-like ATPase